MNVKRSEERGANMSIRAAIMLCLAILLVMGTTGCSEETVTSAPTAADLQKDRAALANRKPAKARAAEAENAANAEAVAGAEEAAYADVDQDYFYDPRNKRDPFRSYRFVGESAAEKSFGPLGDFELGQLELSAVIWDATNPRALILDPGGRSYIVREGSQIGKNSGQVIHIGDNLVLVKETYENFAGERTTKDVELRIRLSQGG
jgi:type IV pilus assembly protein PilP